MGFESLLGSQRTGRTAGERGETMPEDRDALITHFRSMRAGLLDAIAGIDDDALTAETLDGWSVKDHLAHLAAWDDIRASEVARISAGHASAWRMSGDQDAAYNTLVHDLRRGLSLAQVRWELDASHARLIAAISVATDRALDASLYGEAPITSTHDAEHTGWIRRWRSEQGR